MVNRKSQEKAKSNGPPEIPTITSHLVGGIVLRLVTLAYVIYQDATNLKKATDIDYVVFTDASRHVLDGHSPYDRHTYRYTPLIAWMLVPNITLTPIFGKLVFIASDIVAGYLIFINVRTWLINIGYSGTLARQKARKSAATWFYCPISVVCSTRGSAESIIITLTLTIVYLYQRNRYFLTGIMLGLSIHFKIYPIVFSLPLYTALSDKKRQNWLVNKLMPNPAKIQLVIGTILPIVILTVFFYCFYGYKFLHDAYLYHISRKDVRHNFSVYNYLLYLTVNSENIGISLLAFVPQIIFLLCATWKYGSHRDDIPFCIFLQTYVFVTYNKVVTFQYFEWYFSLFVLIMPALKEISTKEGLCMLLGYVFSMLGWIHASDQLELNGLNYHWVCFICGQAFFCSNIFNIGRCIQAYQQTFTSRPKAS